MKKQETRDESLAKGGPSQRTDARGSQKTLTGNSLEDSLPEWAKIPYIKKFEPEQPEPEPVNNEKSCPLFNAAVRQATGTVDDWAGLTLLAQATAGSFSTYDPRNNASKTNTALALLNEIGPKDGIEGMLAVQMLGIHNLAMKFLDRSLSYEQPLKEPSEHVNRAVQCLRVFTAQVKTLSEYRNKGRQKITVEHVQVNAGGQVLVGIVEHKSGGEGAK
jgi:hypothetical protein